MTGTCGTCGRDAEATASNEGYSECCNDRIEYGVEAAETKQRTALEARGWTYDPENESLFEPDVQCTWMAPNGTWVRGTTPQILEAIVKGDPMVMALEKR